MFAGLLEGLATRSLMSELSYPGRGAQAAALLVGAFLAAGAWFGRNALQLSGSALPLGSFTLLALAPREPARAAGDA